MKWEKKGKWRQGLLLSIPAYLFTTITPSYILWFDSYLPLVYLIKSFLEVTALVGHQMECFSNYFFNNKNSGDRY